MIGIIFPFVFSERGEWMGDLYRDPSGSWNLVLACTRKDKDDPSQRLTACNVWLSALDGRVDLRQY